MTFAAIDRIDNFILAGTLDGAVAKCPSGG
jgi:hypothetical protein